jgi:hypothetical protein
MPRSAASATVHIIVTCTNRKRYPVPAQSRLGDLQESRQALRFVAWTRRLGADEPGVPAIDLYGGEHWQVARGLPAVVGDSARLWVCSAGYGLVAANTRLNPYAATFSPGDADSVGGTTGQIRDWWRRLTDWAGPEIGQPRSFVDLARRDPTASVVAVLSDAYIRACSDDLRDAADQLDDRDRFAVIGPATRSDHVDDLLVPVYGRLRPLVGGSLQALHARVTAYLLGSAMAQQAIISRSSLRDAAQLAADIAPVDSSRRSGGTRLSDQEVRTFIRAELAAAAASATVLLRRLRESGRSCEQSRFKHLFAEILASGVEI